MKSVKANIVEGYGRRRYKNDYIKFIVYSLSSNDETIDHLETLFETKSLESENKYKSLSEKLELLGKKLNRFIQSVEKHHNELNEDIAIYQTSSIQYPVSSIQNPVSSIQNLVSNI
jgi:ABC-type antimicrobial peptide transport system permease subunit